MTELKIFKSISIGGLTKEQLIHQLTDAGVQFNKYATLLFEHPSFFISANTEQVSLIKVKSSELGISAPCSFQEIINRASNSGLKLCPLYLGAFLRLEYLDQPEGPYLTVASVKPEKDEDHPSGFYLRNFDNSLWLRGYQATNDYQWPIESEFIFLK